MFGLLQCFVLGNQLQTPYSVTQIHFIQNAAESVFSRNTINNVIIWTIKGSVNAVGF